MTRPTMESTLTAYRQAREQAVAAKMVEAEILHALLFDAHEAGMSIRETAALAQIPKSAVARHRLGPSISTGPWLTSDAYVAANNAAWKHEPGEQVDAAPFVAETAANGTTRITAIPWRWQHPS